MASRVEPQKIREFTNLFVCKRLRIFFSEIINKKARKVNSIKKMNKIKMTSFSRIKNKRNEAFLDGKKILV